MADATPATKTPEERKATRAAREAADAASGKKFFKNRDLAAAVVDKTGLPKNRAQAATDAVLEALGAQLKEGAEVRLAGFGSFAVTDRKGGPGRDPRTGAEITIPASKSVRFHASKALRDAIGGKAAA